LEREKVSLPRLELKAIVQGHCHHKSLIKFEKEDAVLRRMGLDYEVVNSGCCGMAGAFGYENDKYEVAQAIGESVLLPRVREASETTLIVADGFSCRGQIEQSTGRSALHLAEVIEMASRNKSAFSAAADIRTVAKKRKFQEKRDRVIAGASLAAMALGGFFLYRRLAR
jgi:Fe-S oxidoreductase